MDKLNIGKTLIAKRREKGITQEELAQFIGVSKASVSKWETGQSYPDITFLPQLAAYFNISIDELIRYEPQMTKEDIRKLYLRLAKDAAEKDFGIVLAEIGDIIRKYFSCFPLLFHMGAFLLNHHTLAAPDQRQTLLREALSLFVRVKTESDDLALCKQAKVMEAYCHLLLSEPIDLIDLLADATTPTMNELNLLAMGYRLNNQPDKAAEVLQIGIYENLLSLLQNLAGLIQTEAANADKVDAAIARFMKVAEAFNVSELHPSTMLSFHLMAAQVRLMLGNPDRALDMLEQYSELASRIRYPIRLHGDPFFDKIEDWLTELDLGTETPRNDKVVRQSIVDSVLQNPAFAPLVHDIRFKNIAHRLKSVLEG